MVTEQLKNAIEKLKTDGRIVTNVYSANVLQCATQFFNDENALLFFYNDHGVNRLYYYAHRLEDLTELIATLPDSEYVLEFMTKSVIENSEVLKQLGFVCLAQLMRMSVRNCTLQTGISGIDKYYDETVGIFPKVDSARDINHVLWNVFDTRVSHLLNDEEMVTAIKNKELLIHQNSGGGVDAVLQTVIQPHRFYINQVYNGADKGVIHAMLQKRLKEYTDAGGKYMYAWVDSNNIASIKFHQKYGLQHDGMWNMVYAFKKD